VRNWGGNSEFERLVGVLLCKSTAEIGNHPAPEQILHLAPMDYPALAGEFDDLIAAYKASGIGVTLIDPAPIGHDRRYLYNMIYCRDLFFMTPDGAILANMANPVRREEPRYAERTLTSLGIPIVSRVCGEGRFEGADALWLREDLVLVGVGHRTNSHGYRQVKAALHEQGVVSLQVPSYQTRTQHLLGTLQIVDRNLALLRHEIVDQALVGLLEEYGFTIVRIPENQEVRSRQAMNIVCVAPRTIFMTAGCPETRALYEEAGLTIAAELELTQLMRGAGGLACATGIMARASTPRLR